MSSLSENLLALSESGAFDKGYTKYRDYEGDRNAAGQPDGRGSFIDDRDGVRYQGEFDDGVLIYRFIRVYEVDYQKLFAIFPSSIHGLDLFENATETLYETIISEGMDDEDD